MLNNNNKEREEYLLHAVYKETTRKSGKIQRRREDKEMRNRFKKTRRT
jgi:hypothetical protein